MHPPLPGVPPLPPHLIMLAGLTAGITQALLVLVDLLYPGLAVGVRAFLGFSIAKLVGDAIYFYTIAPDRRDWLYAEDYFLHEFVVYGRFSATGAFAQGYVALQLGSGLLRAAWMSALVPTAVYILNRHLVEQAQNRRHRPGRWMRGAALDRT